MNIILHAKTKELLKIYEIIYPDRGVIYKRITDEDLLKQIHEQLTIGSLILDSLNNTITNKHYDDVYYCESDFEEADYEFELE